ncbi:MAG: hypothetical protein RL398_3522 [Planctomycetota bacterium]|jgi:hypothetical protein
MRTFQGSGALLALALAACHVAAPKTSSVSPGTSLDVVGKVAEGAPKLHVRSEQIPYAEHKIALAAGRPVRLTVLGLDEDFDPILECRPIDGAPNETLRNDDKRGLGQGAQVEVLPLRDGEWLVHVGDAHARYGGYRLTVEPIVSREVFTGHGEVASAKTGTEPPVTMFCSILAGRSYRIAVDATGFAPHLAFAGPGAAQAATNDGQATFVAPVSGQLVVQVSSLGLASGEFTLTVTEVW